MDLIIRNARILHDAELHFVDIGIVGSEIAAIEPGLRAEASEIDAAGCLVVPGLIETHIHLDKTCILDRCRIEEGTVAEAARQIAAAKRNFTAEDVYARARRTLERCIVNGTMRMRTHVELDPGIGMTGFDAITQLKQDYAWALDLEICVFPQEGLTNYPGTEELLIEGLRRGARTIGAAPYFDTDPRGQIDRIFAIAREFDAEIDMHLDLAETTEGMQIDYVCRKTEEYGWGGRVAVGHVTQMSLVPPERFNAIARRLADTGVAVTVLPSTDLHLMGRRHDHAVPRGVVPLEPLRKLDVTCSISTNNVQNPFTPYGDGSLIRMANLYANVCHVARPDDLAGCLDMITGAAAKLLRLDDYGIAVGGLADLVCIDAKDPAATIATLAQPLWGFKRGRLSFTWERPKLHAP
ncbi:amidohydrolase family protein [Bradyrhizobium sp.]|uniref:amidohydrolase family protein n=1 Tax=Bradyrhizobium sp. TaxID=376 RepID=UPI001ED51446|nr:amidohydrolase family protein [Bradyrhizobium sp.]MBV8922258.1 amidohydrolase family protein [Bradyrhizobium sp.]MBV9985186.1 amidohydrolase family protein [Bradyrhizobium sp.]